MPTEVLGTDPGDGIEGIGTTLNGAVSGAIGMITKISIEGAEADEIDVTTMNSPGKWRKFIAGLKDAKGINLELVYHKVNMTKVIALVGGDNENWVITFPDGSTLTNKGFVKKLGTAIPFETKVTQQATIRLSGPPTWVEGGS